MFYSFAEWQVCLRIGSRLAYWRDEKKNCKINKIMAKNNCDANINLIINSPWHWNCRRASEREKAETVYWIWFFSFFPHQIILILINNFQIFAINNREQLSRNVVKCASKTRNCVLSCAIHSLAMPQTNANASIDFVANVCSIARLKLTFNVDEFIQSLFKPYENIRTRSIKVSTDLCSRFMCACFCFDSWNKRTGKVNTSQHIWRFIHRSTKYLCLESVSVQL